MDWKTVYKDLKRINWAVLLVLSSISYFVMDRSQTAGVILGGLIIIVNFGILQHTIRRAFSSDGATRRSKMSIIAKYYLRILALGAIIYCLITRGLVDPVGLAVGLSTVMLSIVSFGFYMARKTYCRGAT